MRVRQGHLWSSVLLAYPVFLASFFLSAHDKFTNNLFYLALLAFLLGPFWPMLRVLACLRLGQVVLAYLAYHLLTVIWSDPYTFSQLRQQSLHSLYVLGFILMGLWVLRTEQDIRQLWQLLTGAALLAGWVLLITFGLTAESRLSGWEMLGHPGLAATLYGTVWLWWFAQPTQDYRTGLLHGGVLLGLGGVILLTQSRGPLLALLLCMLLGWVLARRWWGLLTLLALGLGYGVLVSQGHLELPGFFQRHGWDSYRLEIWQQVWHDIQAAPLWGHGSQTPLAYPVSSGRIEPHPHNLFLTAWVLGGAIELLLLSAWLGLALWQGERLRQRTGDAGLTLQLSFAVICGLTDGAGLVYHPMPFWLYVWLPVTWALAVAWGESDSRLSRVGAR